jgi:hypothetical protein
MARIGGRQPALAGVASRGASNTGPSADRHRASTWCAIRHQEFTLPIMEIFG